jgi:hypothetical protein
LRLLLRANPLGILSVDQRPYDRHIALALEDFWILFSPFGEPALQVLAIQHIAFCRFVREIDRDRQNESILSIGGVGSCCICRVNGESVRQNKGSFCSILCGGSVTDRSAIALRVVGP